MQNGGARTKKVERTTDEARSPGADADLFPPGIWAHRDWKWRGGLLGEVS